MTIYPQMQPHVFAERRRVEFHETDLAGIAHFSNYFRWMEATENAFLKSIGIPLIEQSGTSFRGWPRVRASAKFQQPVTYGDDITIQLWIDEVRDRSVAWRFTVIRHRDGEPDTKAATGTTTTVYAEKDAGSPELRALEITETIRRRLNSVSGAQK